MAKRTALKQSSLRCERALQPASQRLLQQLRQRFRGAGEAGDVHSGDALGGLGIVIGLAPVGDREQDRHGHAGALQLLQPPEELGEGEGQLSAGAVQLSEMRKNSVLAGDSTSSWQ